MVNNFSLVPEQQTQYSASGGSNYSQGTTNQQATQNQYGAGQEALQGQLGGLYQNLLAGQVPTQFTQNPNLIGQYNTQFSQNVAPQLAIQGGAGNPQIASNYVQGLQSLLANQYNIGIGQYMQALGGASGFGLTPIGQSGNSYGQTWGGNSYNQTGNQTTSIPFSLLSALTNALQQGPNWLPQGAGSNNVVGGSFP